VNLAFRFLRLALVCTFAAGFASTGSGSNTAGTAAFAPDYGFQSASGFSSSSASQPSAEAEFEPASYGAAPSNPEDSQSLFKQVILTTSSSPAYTSSGLAVLTASDTGQITMGLHEQGSFGDSFGGDSFGGDNNRYCATPEPAGGALVAIALLCLLFSQRRKSICFL
jgi:hypothetical protein